MLISAAVKPGEALDECVFSQEFQLRRKINSVQTEAVLILAIVFFEGQFVPENISSIGLSSLVVQAIDELVRRECLGGFLVRL